MNKHLVVQELRCLVQQLKPVSESAATEQAAEFLNSLTRSVAQAEKALETPHEFLAIAATMLTQIAGALQSISTPKFTLTASGPYRKQIGGLQGISAQLSQLSMAVRPRE